jgi:hypothetical protein
MFIPMRYESFHKHCHKFVIRDVSSLPRRTRFRFYYRIMQTFEVLRMHTDPRFRIFLDDHRVRRVIVSEAQRWITEPYYMGRLHINDRMPWYKQFITLKMGNMNPFGETWDRTDHHLSYMLDNISCGDSIVGDIVYTLETITEQYDWLYCPSCMIETREEVAERVKITRGDRAQRQQWLDTVSAPAIARVAFDLGWDNRMLAVVRDFTVEVLMRKPSNYDMMCLFLKSVEESVLKEQQTEEDCNIAFTVALIRGGLDAEIRRMILPGKTRYLGAPLAMMPPYINLQCQHCPSEAH